MTQGYTRPARLEDVPFLADNLREADIAEIKAVSGANPRDAIHLGVEMGATVACLPDDTPVAIWGITNSHEDGLGAIWMVATNQFKALHRQFLRECRQGIMNMAGDYRVLFNLTDARNTVHHRWIEWAGFTFIKRHEEYGVEKRPFLEFARITERHDV